MSSPSSELERKQTSWISERQHVSVDIVVDIDAGQERLLRECYRNDSDSDDEQTTSIREAFNKFDRDGDGLLGPHDLKGLLHTFGLTLDEDGDFQDFMKVADLNQDGMIDFGEFERMMTMTSGPPSRVPSSRLLRKKSSLGALLSRMESPISEVVDPSLESEQPAIETPTISLPHTPTQSDT